MTCKEAWEEVRQVQYRVKLRNTGWLFAKPGKASKAAKARLDEAWKELDEALDRLAEVCGWRVTVVQTDPGPPPKGFELRVHPRVKKSDEKDVKDVLGRLPAKHKKGLGGITLKGKAKGGKKSSKGKHGVTAGDYDRRTKKINDYYPPTVDTIKHEVGHHVYYEHLSKKQRKAWSDWWGKKANKKKMPNGYAKTHAREGWAEVYEYYYDKKKLDPTVKQKFEELIGAIT